MTKSPTSCQAWIRVDAGAQSTAAYILASETVSLVVYAHENDCLAVVLDAAGGACTSSPTVSTCHCGPRTLEDKVSRCAADSKGTCTRVHVHISIVFYKAIGMAGEFKFSVLASIRMFP